MIRQTLAISAVLALFAAPAMAGQCPRLMNQIDAALAQNPQLTEAQMTQVAELRKRGEELHQASTHGESVAALNQALSILGLN